MISKKVLLTITLMAAAIFVHVAPAAATTPNCSSGRNKRGYDIGVLAGRSIVRQAWNGTDQDPDQFDDFMDTVHQIVHTAITGLPNDASDFNKCRARGLGQGVCDELGDIQGGIGAACKLDGQVWGDLSAELYCALSIEFNGQDVLGLMPDAPATLCGEKFEEGCHANFTSFATSQATCQPYTVNPFHLVFADWKIGMCLYEAP